LIRWVNLLFIALTQVLLQYIYLRPILENPFISVESSLNHLDFGLLVFSTILVAGAGYIINDYFDVKADEINKPHRIIIDRVISRRSAIWWHTVFNFIAIVIGFYLGYKVGCWCLGFIHLGVTIMLWVYSTFLKKQAIVGNLLVSLMTALVVMMVWWYEPNLVTVLKGKSGPLYEDLRVFFWGYAGFAFLLTFIRELVKDMEDIRGDKQDGGYTLPIVWGIRKTKRLTTVLVVVCMLCLLKYQISEGVLFAEQTGGSFFSSPITRLLFTFVQLPLFFMLILLQKADKPADFKKISNVVKLIMLVGILLLFYFYGLNTGLF